MARNIDKIAASLGANRTGQIPETGGGAFGAARLAGIIATMQARLSPGPGHRPGCPTDPKRRPWHTYQTDDGQLS